jgi:hypothetical protein|tara:strand:+ start:11281 stop:11937 length:657 start_codon:yes stop_codon:yes gene_type:complete
MEEILPGLGAGIVSTLICNPLDTIRINYQLGNEIKYTTNYLYRGLGYSVIGIPVFWSIYFPMYKKLKEDFSIPVSAYISCCTASTFTTPFWVLRQAKQTDKKINYSIKSLYNGLLPTYLINLSFTIQMPLYEYMKSNVENNTFNVFICTAVSKTVATCIFYPLDTIRARLRDGQICIYSNMTNYYRGMSIYILRSLPYHVSVFCTYEYIKNYFIKNLV